MHLKYIFLMISHDLGGFLVFLLGVSQIDRVVEVVEETLKGNKVRLFGKKTLPRLDLPKVRRNKHVEIVPLSTGCLGRYRVTSDYVL